MKQLPKDKDIDLMSYEDLVRHRPDLVESIGRKAARVENIDEATKNPRKWCLNCGAPIKLAKESAPDGFKESDPIGTRQPVPGTAGYMVKVSEAGPFRRAKTDTKRMDALKQSLKETFMLGGLNEAEANIAAGIDEGTFAGVPISDLKKG